MVIYESVVEGNPVDWIFYDGYKWGSVCTNGFGDDAGNVACRQLGYGKYNNVYTYS